MNVENNRYREPIRTRGALVTVVGIVNPHPSGDDIAEVQSYDWTTDTYEVLYPSGRLDPFRGQYSQRMDHVLGERLVDAPAGARTRGVELAKERS